MLFKSAVAVALMAGAASAQTNATNIDPNTVEAQTRASWCIGQRSACSTLCGGNAGTTTNNCDQTTLAISCLCSNGSAPALSLYMNTMPYFICQQSFALCIKAHPDDALGQGTCKTNIESKCGTLNLTNFQATPSSSSVSSSSSVAASTTAAPAATTGTGTATAAATTATKTGAAIALRVGQEFGYGAVAAGLIAAFGYLL